MKTKRLYTMKVYDENGLLMAEHKTEHLRLLLQMARFYKACKPCKCKIQSRMEVLQL